MHNSLQETCTSKLLTKPGGDHCHAISFTTWAFFCWFATNNTSLGCPATILCGDIQPQRLATIGDSLGGFLSCAKLSFEHMVGYHIHINKFVGYHW
jgi:hypothetical protein